MITELSKLARTTDMLFKIRHYVPSKTLKFLYYSLFLFSFFYSFIPYGIAMWGLNPPNGLGLSLQIAKESCQSHFFQE